MTTTLDITTAAGRYKDKAPFKILVNERYKDTTLSSVKPFTFNPLMGVIKVKTPSPAFDIWMKDQQDEDRYLNLVFTEYKLKDTYLSGDVYYENLRKVSKKLWMGYNQLLINPLVSKSKLNQPLDPYYLMIPGFLTAGMKKLDDDALRGILSAEELSIYQQIEFVTPRSLPEGTKIGDPDLISESETGSFSILKISPRSRDMLQFIRDAKNANPKAAKAGTAFIPYYAQAYVLHILFKISQVITTILKTNLYGAYGANLVGSNFFAGNGTTNISLVRAVPFHGKDDPVLRIDVIKFQTNSK